MVNKPAAKRTSKTSLRRDSSARLKKRNYLEKAKAERKDKILVDRLDVLNYILKFRGFLASAFDPVIDDSEIIVCFADVLGFTNYCRKLKTELQDS